MNSINSSNKISAPKWNEEYDFPDESYSISDIQDYFNYILKNMERKLLILHLELCK